MNSNGSLFDLEETNIAQDVLNLGFFNMLHYMRNIVKQEVILSLLHVVFVYVVSILETIGNS